MANKPVSKKKAVATKTKKVATKTKTKKTAPEFVNNPVDGIKETSNVTIS